MKNVLVFPCGSEIAFEIYRSLQHSKHFRLIGANSIADHGKFVYEDYVADVPFITDVNFIPTMKHIVKEYNIDYIYPSMDSAISLLKENEDALGCYVISSPKETTRICSSKKKTYECLYNIVRTPQIYRQDDNLQYPVFCKPDIGYGARGANIINNYAMLSEQME